MQQTFKGYNVWSSIRGNSISGIVTSHLVREGESTTLCGKPKGKMTTKYTTFSATNDCKLCAKKAGLRGEKA